MLMPPFPEFPKLPPAPWAPREEDREESFSDERPACIVADESRLVLGYLESLADEWKHFGVLRIGEARLRRASDAAELVHEHELSEELAEFAGSLVRVRDVDAAREAAASFRPLARRAWDIGALCKGLDSDTVLEMGEQIARGELTRDEAIERVMEEG